MKKLCGTYTMIPCKHDASPEEKFEAVRKGIERLIKEHHGFVFIPDFDTMKFIVHETIHSKKGLDWYCNEKGQQIDDEEEVISVGIKYEAEMT